MTSVNKLEPTGTLTGSNRDAGEDDQIVAAVQEYLLALENGKRPLRQEFLSRHAEIAESLEPCLDGLEFVHQAATNLRPHSPVAGSALGDELVPLPLGDFRLVREIGRGGMGIVYEAVQLSLGRRVAVKVLPLVASLDPTRLQRFKMEAQAAAQLHHTNIVPVYSVGVERGVHFYAMQYIVGHSLSALLGDMRSAQGAFLKLHSGDEPSAPSPSSSPVVSSSRPSTPLTTITPHSLEYFRAVAGMVQQVARALDHAHRFGVIHRDVKPANLLLDELGHIWITDFGLAQVQADAQLTHTGDMIGTLRYMSPEQVEGDRVLLDQRTDIYSLGVTLYELLTLTPAFSGPDRQVLVERITGEEPRAPRSRDNRIPLELETIVLKAIAKSPADRYQTAAQLAEDLGRWLDDRPILARRPTFWEHVARWQRRHKALVRSAVAFLVLTLGVMFASMILITREHTKTLAAYRGEVAQRQAAEESFRQARHAVDAFLALEEEELANRPSMHQVRRKFLQAALEYYSSFLDQRQDDPSLQAELAETRAQMERIAEEMSVLSRFAPLTLLSDMRVQQELRMEPGAAREISDALNDLYEDWQFTSTTSEGAAPASRQQQLVTLLRERERLIVGLLTSAQLERLNQIAWQQRRHIAFKYPDLVEMLRLSPEQRRAINDIVDEFRPAGPPGGGMPPGPPPGRREPPRDGGPPRRPPQNDSSQRAMAKIMKVLTPEQISIWNVLTGEPFDHDLHWGPDEWMPR